MFETARFATGVGSISDEASCAPSPVRYSFLPAQQLGQLCYVDRNAPRQRLIRWAFNYPYLKAIELPQLSFGDLGSVCPDIAHQSRNWDRS